MANSLLKEGKYANRAASDSQSDPYRQYMRVVDCYELSPPAGNVIALDKCIKVDRAFAALCEQNVRAGLIWDASLGKMTSIVTLTDFLAYLRDDASKCSSTEIGELASCNGLVSVSADAKVFEACEEFCLHRVHRIIVREPQSGDILYLLTIKRVLQAIHKQMDKRVIRGIYLYEFKLGTTAKEADEKINAAFGQGCSTIRTAYRWNQKFRNGDESLEEHECRGRHSDVDEDKLRDVVEEDPHKGTREIAKNRSLHFAQWLSTPIRNSGVGTWETKIHTVSQDDCLSDVVEKLLGHKLSSLPVVDSNGHATDVITKADLAMALMEVNGPQTFLSDTTVAKVLGRRPPAVFIRPSDPVGKLLDAILEALHMRCVFIVDEHRKPIACVSQSDVISHLIYDDAPFQKPPKSPS
ncbi:unnamed protein product [Heligmosomoides polygyrus]|uniref:CBS domain-containing protein n=1 Tax=Heligmosomoides polygyrus TaxID=6339 RepID=A0A3P7XXF5_HELPZ|nr:unnamed protein product [Heligmosomoides polygyrus]